MNTALFGGTFDPIHSGHIRAAEVAAREFSLDRILFIPSGIPPHKQNGGLTPFEHRFAMVALACARDARFVPSLAEAPRSNGQPHFSIDTVRAVKKTLGARDRLYFLVGWDALLDLPHWKQYRRLLDSVDFIVVSRPGFTSRNVWDIIPQEMIRSNRNRVAPDTVRLRSATLHLLRGIDVPVASRDIRETLRRDGPASRRLAGLVPHLVEEYIRKEGLYRPVKAKRRSV